MNALYSAVMKGSGGSEKLIRVVLEAWRPMDGVRNGYGDDSPGLQTPFIPPRWWETARESDQPAVVMLECDVNLYYCSGRQSRNGGQWSRRNLHGGKVRRGGPVAVTTGKRCSIYSSLGMSTSMTVSGMSK
jgi:hypothetical protein